jgi:hypothetical protein
VHISFGLHFNNKVGFEMIIIVLQYKHCSLFVNLK